jgi:hypothetical protein
MELSTVPLRHTLAHNCSDSLTCGKRLSFLVDKQKLNLYMTQLQAADSLCRSRTLRRGVVLYGLPSGFHFSAASRRFNGGAHRVSPRRPSDQTHGGK